MMSNRRLLLLVVGNIILGVVAALLVRVDLHDPFGLAALFPPSGLKDILLVPFFASVFCQALLLALWGAYSGVSPWLRMAGMVVGTVYLEALLPDRMRREFLGISTITVTVTTATLLVMRALGVRLNRQDESAQPMRAEPEGLRFSIRGLMLFTAAVALLSAGARALQDTPRRLFLQEAVLAMCFVAAGLMALWAGLGNARPPHRGAVVFALSPVLGAFFAFAVHAHKAGWAYIMLTMLLYPAVLLASLLVVRSCGYRLVRRVAS
jgi:hypothetical protein